MGDSPLYSPEFLADTREKELDAACEALGLDDGARSDLAELMAMDLEQSDLLD